SLGLHVNLEWGLYAGLVCAGAYTIAMRNDLLWTEVASAVTFLPVYALALILWLAVFPGVHEWFTLRGLPHWYLLGVPLSEIVFGVLFAAYWSGLYPMLFEQQLVDVRSGSAAQGRRVGGESPKVVPGVDAG
ncbi:MAG TPA: hypothetical protein VFB34_09505, partial [Chloroflexota bacterium]|nr:hypothetical protein [Chloroflexota bacterium]